MLGRALLLFTVISWTHSASGVVHSKHPSAASLCTFSPGIEVLAQADGHYLLPGHPDTPAITALPVSPYDPAAHLNEDYLYVDGYYYPVSVIDVGFTSTATVGRVNKLLAEVGAEIVGSLPGRVDQPQVGGIILTLRVAIGSFEALLNLTQALAQDSIVSYATPHLFESSLDLPPSP